MNKYIEPPIKDNISRIRYKYHNLMRVKPMRMDVQDASGISQHLSRTQVTVQTLEELNSDKEGHSLGAIFYFDSHWLAFTFSQNIFWPLERTIGQKVKLHWSDISQWPLFIEAILGQLAGIKLTMVEAMIGANNEREAVDYPVVSNAPDFLDKINLVKVFDLSKDREEFDSQTNAYCLTESAGFNFDYQSNGNNVVSLCMMMKPKLLDELTDFLLNVSAKIDTPPMRVISALNVEVNFIKPFQELTQEEMDGLVAGDGVEMSPKYKDIVWVRVGQQDTLLQIDLNRLEEKSGYEIISVNNTKNSFCSFGIQKLVPGTHWLADYRGEIKKGLEDLQQVMDGEQGWFYVGHEPIIPASVTEYQGQPVLKIES